MNRPIGSATKAPPLVVALVGAILPDDALADFPAASFPGNAFQRGVLNELRAHGIHTSVISLRPVSSYPQSPQLFFGRADGTICEGVPYREIGFINAGPLKTLTAAFTSFAALLRWTRQHRGERRVMLFYNAYNPSAWVGVVAAWLTCSKVIAIVADVRVPGSGGGEATLLRRIEYNIAIAALRRIDAIVSVTPNIAADFAPGVPHLSLDGGVADDLLVPLPAPKRYDDSDTARATDGDPFIVLYAGSLTQLAGVPFLLQAFKRLEQSRFRLWIAGDGELEADVRGAAASDPRIRYFGRLPRRDLLAIYNAADVLVNPHSTTLLTARYVFPSKLLEYLASGRPVITTATPEIAAAYGDFCTVLDSEDPQALADAIVRVATVPVADWLARAAMARAAVIERCAWPRQGRRLVQFLEEQTSVCAQAQ